MTERILWKWDGTGVHQKEEEAWVKTIKAPKPVYAVIERDLKVLEGKSTTVEKVMPIVVIQFDDGVDSDGKQHVFEVLSH